MSRVGALIARTRELHAAATPEPWEHPEWCHKCELSHIEGPEDVGGTGIGIRVRVPGDLTLIAEYRTIAPKLADMLERAMEELECVRVSSSFRIRQDAADAIDEIEAMAEGGES